MSRDVNLQIDIMANALRRRSLVGSYAVANETLKLLRTVISNSKWATANQIIAIIQNTAEKLQSAQPIELAVSNLCGRVLNLIRTEYEDVFHQGHAGLLHRDALTIDYNENCYQLKATIIEGIREIMNELESSRDNISVQALEHIHSK